MVNHRDRSEDVFGRVDNGKFPFVISEFSKFEPVVCDTELLDKSIDPVMEFEPGKNPRFPKRALYANITFGFADALPNTTELRS